MRHREEIIRVNELPVISRHAQQNFIIVVTANTDDRLRHQTKMVLLQRLLDLFHHHHFIP